VIAQTRPVLEAQKDVLSKALLGDHSSYSSTCDLFAVKAGNGDLWLYHTAPSDVPGMVETHASPGIYSDPLLLQKASTTADQGLGDTLHEKLRIPEGGLPPLYVADVDGSVWRIAVDPPEGDHIRVGLRPADGGE